MKQLKNKILNEILEKFMEKKGVKNKKKPIKIVKYIPILNFCNFIRFDGVAQVLCFFSIVFGFVGILPFIVSNDMIHVNSCYELTSIFFSFCYLASVINYKSALQEKESLDDFKEGDVALSVEDFNAIISTLNKEIVAKIIKDNNGSIKYNNLEKLDELLLNEDETINKIYNENIDKLLEKIDREKLVAILKNKGMEGVIFSLKKSGLNVKDCSPLIQEERVLSQMLSSVQREKILN